MSLKIKFQLTNTCAQTRHSIIHGSSKTAKECGWLKIHGDFNTFCKDHFN